LSGLTDNNNENAKLLIIAYQYFSCLMFVFTIKIPLKQRYFFWFLSY